MDQLDLFSDRTMSFARARKAVEELDLPTAHRALTEHLRRYPDDGLAREHLHRVGSWQAAIKAARAKGELERLAVLGDHLPEDLIPSWHERLAETAERTLGPGAYVGNVPAGLHFLLGGDAGRAEASLRATLEQRPHDGRARAYLGDALFLQGDATKARLEYLRAFAETPAEVDLEKIADAAVADLVDHAAEYDIESDAVCWVAALGVLTGVFAPTQLSLPALHEAQGHGAHGREATEPVPGLRFFELMLIERSTRSHEERIAVRREMKRLCPPLLAAYLKTR